MEQANLNIGSIGQKLEAARQAKGITVSEAGKDTKILSKFIEAMEADDFGALAAPVYAKSFIRMYAQYLGLDAQPLVDEYVAQHAPKSKPHLGEEAREPREPRTQTDNLAVDSNGSAVASMSHVGQMLYGNINEAITRISGRGWPMKKILYAAGGIVLLLIIMLSIKQCEGDEAEEPSAVGGAASVSHEVITEEVPDIYLAKPGEIDVDR